MELHLMVIDNVMFLAFPPPLRINLCSRYTWKILRRARNHYTIRASLVVNSISTTFWLKGYSIPISNFCSEDSICTIVTGKMTKKKNIRKAEVKAPKIIGDKRDFSPFTAEDRERNRRLKRLKTDENIVIMLAGKGRMTVVMENTDYNTKWTPLLTIDRLMTYLNGTRHPKCNANLTTNCLRWRKPTKNDFRGYFRVAVFRSHLKKLNRLRGLLNTQTQHTYEAHRFFLWVPDLPTV